MVKLVFLFCDVYRNFTSR